MLVLRFLPLVVVGHSWRIVMAVDIPCANSACLIPFAGIVLGGGEP